MDRYQRSVQSRAQYSLTWLDPPRKEDGNDEANVAEEEGIPLREVEAHLHGDESDSKDDVQDLNNQHD